MPTYYGRGKLLSVISMLLMVFSVITLGMYGIRFIYMILHALGIVSTEMTITAWFVVYAAINIAFALFELKTGMEGMNYRSKDICFRYGRINLILIVIQSVLTFITQARLLIRGADSASVLSLFTAFFPIVLPILYLVGVRLSEDK